ncbi:MAG: hypothetical protein OQJ84_01590 [Xanthomonadales bacterium]|nr:hypothetical protein [Xanthomonadales bacterium]
MRNVLAAAGILVLLCSPVLAANRVEESRTWSERFAVTHAAPTLEISNIWGDVTVRTGNTGEISVTVSEYRSAPDQSRFERSQEYLKLNIEADENSVSMWVGHHDRNWHGHNPCRGCRVDYRFEIVAPADTLLDVGTVNDGRVEVSGITSVFNASNVNGPVSVSGLDNCTVLESVNGEVSASFAHAPDQDCNIETVNGDIELKLPEKAGLNVAMDLFNGRMKTEFQVDPLAIPARVEESRSDGHYRYRIDQAAGVSIAGGGPTFTISSINGDIRIQKNR